jgi:uncharacterized protein
VPIVSNSSPLILYTRIGRLELLRELFGEVLIPPAVHLEVVVRGQGRPGSGDVEQAAWIESRVLRDYTDAQTFLGQINPGEAEAIALAMELGAEMAVILDDYKGRRLAREHGVETVGSGGVLVLAKRQGLIPLVRPVLDELRVAGLHLSERAYREILVKAGEGPGEPDI